MKQNIYFIAAFILSYCTWNQAINASLGGRVFSPSYSSLSLGYIQCTMHSWIFDFVHNLFTVVFERYSNLIYASIMCGLHAEINKTCFFTKFSKSIKAMQIYWWHQQTQTFFTYNVYYPATPYSFCIHIRLQFPIPFSRKFVLKLFTLLPIK